MFKSMRESTLQTLGLGNVIDIFQNGKLPKSTAELVDEVFGPSKNRGALVISGANGIVGAGKAMQFGTRLMPYGIPIVALDFPGAPDGLGMQYKGLKRSFGSEIANKVMGNITQMTYDGKNLPESLKDYNPKFLLEAIPEILEIKKAHYKIFRDKFENIEIRSVTSGFPMSELGVGIAHPAFPHEINKIWEIVEEKPSAVTQMLWALGMIPMSVSDDWSFVLDVLFCGITHAGLQYHNSSNMPVWKIDKYVRKIYGPNPFRAHDAIGAAGANFLTWSCLHHLGKEYGGLFTPTLELDEHKDSGQNWYPLDHFRPLVNWSLDGDTEEEFNAFIMGALTQMTSIMLSEKRGHLSLINSIGEVCAQFTNGILAKIRRMGFDKVNDLVQTYHKLYPKAADSPWYPAVFEEINGAEWQQLYVNAEHDGNAGVITLSRESYNSDVNDELNRAIDWLKADGIKKVILTGDFHLSTQMVGADTSEFYPALEEVQKGIDVAATWSETARRLYHEFDVSVGFINGKRCLGGMLELMTHCHYLISLEGTDLGFPEVTLPVVPGMEGCHWPFRKTTPDNWPNLFKVLFEGKSVKAKNAVGWLVDYAGSMDDALVKAWQIITGGEHGITLRKFEEGPLSGVSSKKGNIADSGDPSMEAARKAIYDNVVESCSKPISEALNLQAKHSADFMLSSFCQKGTVGMLYKKTMKI